MKTLEGVPEWPPRQKNYRTWRAVEHLQSRLRIIVRPIARITIVGVKASGERTPVSDAVDIKNSIDRKGFLCSLSL